MLRAICAKSPCAILSLHPRNVLVHLALEEWILDVMERTQPFPLLLAYRNDPCVVIGRNQLLWKETSQHTLAARRMSGGGAVFHDHGNLNFTLFSSKTAFSREKGVLALHHALRTLGVPDRQLSSSAFHDLLLDGKKISGSAFRISRNAAYHHGTVLFNADLETLAASLQPSEFAGYRFISSKASKSRRSQVANIHECHPSVGMKDLILAMASFLGMACGIYPDIKQIIDLGTYNFELMADSSFNAIYSRLKVRACLF